MKNLCFVTTNLHKAQSLERVFQSLGLDIAIEPINNIVLIEPQCNSIGEVSYSKAKQAYNIIRRPLVVEDGGFEIEALRGFPGPYTKYVLDTIGIEGVLKLMDGISNRRCKFTSTTTYIDSMGNDHQFNTVGSYGNISTKISKNKSDIAWSDFWKIVEIPDLGKTLSELTEEEANNMLRVNGGKSSLIAFAEWLKRDETCSNSLMHHPVDTCGL